MLIKYYKLHNLSAQILILVVDHLIIDNEKK